MYTRICRARARVAAGLVVAMLAASAIPVIGAPPLGATATATTARIAGADRYDTSARVALATFGTANTVILASGDDAHYPDGLAATALAGAYGAPVLLTPIDTLSPYLTNALATLGTHKVIVVGGTAAVSQADADQLSALGFTVSRIAGTDRYDTAAQVAAALLAAVPIGTFNGNNTAFVATGLNWPDALGAGGPAYARHLPILLTDPVALSAQTKTELGSLGITQVIIMGGTGAVSAEVESSIKGLGLTTFRISGINRFDTAAQLATLEWAPVVPGPSFNYAGIQATLPTAAKGFVELVSGLNFPDAESVGPRAGTLGAPVLLDGQPLTAETVGALKANQADVSVVEAIGGTAAVPDADLSAAQAAAGPSGGTATITAMAGETAFSVAFSGPVDPNTEVASAFTVNNAALPGVTCQAVEALICTGLSSPLKGGDLIALTAGAVTSPTGQPFAAASFTVPAATAPSVTATQFVVGGTDFNVTFSRPIAIASLNSSTVVLSGGQAVDFSTKTTNAGGFIPSATPAPTSFTFRINSPVTTGETLTLTTGITDNSTSPIPMALSSVVTATPDNTSPTPSATTHEAITEAPLYAQATGTIGGIAITAKIGTLADGVNGNNFYVQVQTTGVEEATTVTPSSNCTTSNTSAVAANYCITITTGGQSGTALTNALAADSTFSSLFVGAVTGAVAAAGPTALTGGLTGMSVALILNKPLDTNATPGLGTYTLDVLGNGTTIPAFLAAAVDNGAASSLMVVIFELQASAPQLTSSTKLNVVTAPVDFAGHQLTPSVIPVS